MGEPDVLINELQPFLAPPDDAPQRLLTDHFRSAGERFGLGKLGYIRAIVFERLVEVAKAEDCLVGPDFRACDFVVEGGKGIGILSARVARRRSGSAIRCGTQR